MTPITYERIGNRVIRLGRCCRCDMPIVLRKPGARFLCAVCRKKAR